MRELKPGDVAEWDVVDHLHWGVLVTLAGEPSRRGSIAALYVRDLAPGERTCDRRDFPAVGGTIRAVVIVQWHDGRMSLSARQSDVAAATHRAGA